MIGNEDWNFIHAVVGTPTPTMADDFIELKIREQASGSGDGRR